MGITKQASSGSMEATINFSNKLVSVRDLHRNHHRNLSQWSTSACYRNRYNNRNRNRSRAVEMHHYNQSLRFFPPPLEGFKIVFNSNQDCLKAGPDIAQRGIEHGFFEQAISVYSLYVGYNYGRKNKR